MTGAAIQWLRDGLGLIESAAEIGPLAAGTPDSGGVYVVPAFAGLGSPWWDPYARGTIVGITRGTSKAHLARAVVEAMAYQTRDVVEAMTAASGTRLAALRVDGGASVMDVLLQMQSDHAGRHCATADRSGTTALGAAYPGRPGGRGVAVAGCHQRTWEIDATFEPEPDRTFTDLGPRTWLRRRAGARAGSVVINAWFVAIGTWRMLFCASVAHVCPGSTVLPCGHARFARHDGARDTTLPPPVPPCCGGDYRSKDEVLPALIRCIGGMTDVVRCRVVADSSGRRASAPPDTPQHSSGSDPIAGAFVLSRSDGVQRGQQWVWRELDVIVSAARAKGADGSSAELPHA